MDAGLNVARGCLAVLRNRVVVARSRSDRSRRSGIELRRVLRHLRYDAHRNEQVTTAQCAAAFGSWGGEGCGENECSGGEERRQVEVECGDCLFGGECRKRVGQRRIVARCKGEQVILFWNSSSSRGPGSSVARLWETVWSGRCVAMLCVALR